MFAPVNPHPVYKQVHGIAKVVYMVYPPIVRKPRSGPRGLVIGTLISLVIWAIIYWLICC